MAMKKRMTSTPHDAVFKRFLRHPETATDFLTLYLPEAILQRCDFSTLRLQSASFIDEDLRAWYSDVLWSVQTTCGTGYVYVVIEHQSSPDSHMAFRLMRYAIAASSATWMPGTKRCRWWCRCFFITVQPVRILFPSTGWMNLPTRSWRRRCMAVRFH